MEQQKVDTLIIGAGPAGLAIAGRLRKLGLTFEIVEKTDKIAWSWHNHYDRLCLHTVKQLSHLPHLEFPENYPLYVPRMELANYYESYAEHFDIKPHFNQSLKNISPIDGGWKAVMETGDTFLSNQLVFATGVNRVPHIPTWEGQDVFQGEITHSRSYKNPESFIGSKVLIIGMGNTGAEIALDLAEHKVETWISVRSPIAIVPRDVHGRPVQLTAKKLAKVPFGIGDWLGTQIRKRVIGDLSPYGLTMSKEHPTKMLRETGKTPVIDLGTVEHIKNGNIKIIGDITRFYEKGVILKEGDKEFPVDKVILSTGYRAKIEDFIEGGEELNDQNLYPKYLIGEGKFDGLYFLGFDNYQLGGILGTIFRDSEKIADHILIRSK